MQLILGMGLLVAHQMIASDPVYMTTISTAANNGRSIQPQASIELRHESGLGLVAGYGASQRTGHATALRDGVYADVQQKIEAHWASVGFAYSHRITERLSVRGTAGYAFVYGKNREWGTYNGVPVEHHNTTKERAPIFGLGLECSLTDTWAVRVDLQRMNHVVESHWTSSSDITTFGLSVLYRH